MKVLLTGGCGFVGASLVARLAAQGGCRIRVFDNESLGLRSHLPAVGAEFVHGDVRDRKALAVALRDIDTVVHLAADSRVIDSIAEPSYNFDVNVAGTLNLLEEMRKAGIRRLVNASTGGAIVGEVAPPVHEEMVARPASPYGASKLAAEGYCSAYAHSYGLRAISLRFSNVYGPGSYHKGSVVAAFYKRILQGGDIIVYGDGTQVRDFVFVGDVCEGIVAALNGERAGVVQIGSGRPVTINTLIETMRQIVAPRAIGVSYQPFRRGEVRATYCDIGKARRELGFEPAVALAEGLARTWSWFLASDTMRAGQSPAAGA